MYSGWRFNRGKIGRMLRAAGMLGGESIKRKPHTDRRGPPQGGKWNRKLAQYRCTSDTRKVKEDSSSSGNAGGWTQWKVSVVES